jgi:glycosyltransferase involved in cell wall biosynthesis
MGALVEIVDVSLAEPPSGLGGGFLDGPKAGAVIDAHAVDVTGWALGADARAVAVEFGIDGEVFWRAPLRTPRPDVAEAFPDRPESASAGFSTTLNMIGTPPRFEVEVSVVLEGQRRARLATIAGEHRWRRDRTPAFAELVSVVIPCFGQAHFLAEAIESVLAQTYPHLEIVVVDDGSHDNSSRIASRYPSVRCVREPNAGMAAARNLGLRSTNGDFLVFLDADDRLLPDAVEAGLRALDEHPEAAAAIGRYRRIAEDGVPLVTHDQPVVERDHYAQLLRSNWMGFPARAIYRRALFEHVRGFDPELGAAEDFALSLEIARRFPVQSHGTLVAEHREHGSNVSGDAVLMLTKTLVAVKRQRPHVRKTPELKRTYGDAKRFWRSYYGDRVAAQAARSLRERRLGKALRELAVLARHHPRGLTRLLRRDPSPSS